MSKHTPGPWRIANLGSGSYIKAHDETNIASCSWITGVVRTPAAENARLIVRAVNSHADLIAALQECEEYFDNRADAEYFPDSAAPVPNQEMKLLQVVRDALGKAGQ